MASLDLTPPSPRASGHPGSHARRRRRGAGVDATGLARSRQYSRGERRQIGRILHGAVRHAGSAEWGAESAADIAAERRVLYQVRRWLSRHIAGFLSEYAGP